MKLIRPRLQASCAGATALAILLGGAVTAAVWLSLWAPAFRVPQAGETTEITYRLPSLSIYEDFREEPTRRVHPAQVDRHTELDVETAELLNAVESDRRPPGLAYMLGLGLMIVAIYVSLANGLRRLSPEGSLLRNQALVLLTLTVVIIGSLAFLLFTTYPPFWLPIPALVLVFTRAADRPTGLLFGLASVFTLGIVNGFDSNLTIVMGLQCAAVAAVAPAGKTGLLNTIPVWLAVAAVGIAAYAAHRFVTTGILLPADTESFGSSNLVAIGLGAGVMAAIAPAAETVCLRLLGRIPRSRLQKLADFSRPLLRRVASKSPGTWQHTLAVANLAEQVANSIGNDALLARVGALYHDIGKSKQPEYFAENLRDERSPHDTLSPELSADAIISHVTDGIRLAREAGLPERIVDFIHMHHGDTVLQYFWDKNVKQGNPDELGRNDFRYPGIRPQTKETAILAIVDSIEAASRSLKNPSVSDIEGLVRHVLLEKVAARQLDDSGLTVKDLASTTDTLVEMLQSQFHVRPEYPWQQKSGQKTLATSEAAEAAKAAEAAQAAEAAEAAREAEPAGRAEPTRSSGAPETAESGGSAETAEGLGAASRTGPTEPEVEAETIETDDVGAGEEVVALTAPKKKGVAGKGPEATQEPHQ